MIPSLKKDSTKLYLGLVHANGLEVTKQRTQAASVVVDDFGIATECGLGRTPAEDINGVLDIMREAFQNIISWYRGRHKNLHTLITSVQPDGAVGSKKNMNGKNGINRETPW